MYQNKPFESEQTSVQKETNLKPLTNRRRFKRIPVIFSITVEIRESKDKIRVENTNLIDVSPVGIGFFLPTEVVVGELLLVKTPLPPEFCTNNLDECDYSIWGMVRHCQFVKEKDAFYVGTIFIGECPPKSFNENPLTLYRITALKSADFPEIAQNGLKPETVDLKPRKPRYSVPIDISLVINNDKGEITAQEQTVTENISYSGASVFSVLPVNVGDIISMMSEQYNISILAEVRNIRTGKDGLPRLHLKFIGKKFPLHGID